MLETNVSGSGLGTQWQEDGVIKPITYVSRSQQAPVKLWNYRTWSCWAIKLFRPYLYGHSCKVYTDYEVLKSLLNTPQPSGKLARWGITIQELDLRTPLDGETPMLTPCLVPHYLLETLMLGHLMELWRLRMQKLRICLLCSVRRGSCTAHHLFGDKSPS